MEYVYNIKNDRLVIKNNREDLQLVIRYEKYDEFERFETVFDFDYLDENYPIFRFDLDILDRVIQNKPSILKNDDDYIVIFPKINILGKDYDINFRIKPMDSEKKDKEIINLKLKTNYLINEINGLKCQLDKSRICQLLLLPIDSYEEHYELFCNLLNGMDVNDDMRLYSNSANKFHYILPMILKKFPEYLNGKEIIYKYFKIIIDNDADINKKYVELSNDPPFLYIIRYICNHYGAFHTVEKYNMFIKFINILFDKQVDLKIPLVCEGDGGILQLMDRALNNITGAIKNYAIDRIKNNDLIKSSEQYFMHLSNLKNVIIIHMK